MMPTVAHYKCSKCEQLVTHEIVHVTDDLKHDAHIVKMFTEKSIKILQNNYINMCKIIEFTDQAPSQYKNKTAFNYLANTKMPTQKNYFGVRHDKSSCDACTGRVKQGVTRLVKDGDIVVNNAETFYDTFEISHVAALDAYMEQFLAKIIFAHQILQLLTWVQRNQLRLT